MRYGVLGPLTVWDDHGAVVTVPEVKVRALLAVLLANGGGPVPVDRLIHDLWGDNAPGKPLGALQAKASQLRRIIGRDRVVHEPAGYRLRLDGDQDLDAGCFHRLVAQARPVRDPRSRAALLARALDLWRGAPYGDFADEEFVRAAADRLTEQRLSALEDCLRARLEAGEHALVVAELAAVVPRHPLRERLRAVHVHALYLAGRQGDALASYEDLRRRLAEELGVDPGVELRELYQAVLRQDPELDPVAPDDGRRAAGRPPGWRSSNLPLPLTGLIGRERALGRLAELLDTARLVTLTGPGGVGKTRLAIASAAQAGGTGVPTGGIRADGIWLVEFTGVRTGTADNLAQVTAAALGIRDDAPSAPPGTCAGAAPPAQRLVAALRERRALLVLDNCEHVVDAAAELVELLLQGCPGLRVLVTSQEPLGLRGEHVVVVEPLQAADAISLFVERAGASAPGFALDPGGDSADAAAVAEICRRLDGIPLALELAATRVRALGVRELAARLGDRFSVVASRRRGAPPRQRTLRAMIEWSWELLSAPERIVLRRLAVPGDGCDLAAAEAICAGDGVAGAEVLDLVTRLVDRSLVVATDGAAGPRYRLLESVAAYATERLREMDDLAAVRDRHMRHYLELAEQAEPRLRSGEQRFWLERLDAEAGNLRVALDEAIRRTDGGDGDLAARLAVAMVPWWLLRGRLTEGRRSLTGVLGAVPVGSVPEVELVHGAFSLLTGERSAGVAIGTAEAVPDPVRRALALWLCAYGLFSAGDTAASEEWNARALDLCRSTGEQWGTAAASALGAALALVRGDLAGLGREGQRSASLFRRLGDRWGELQTISPLAVLAEIRGDYDDAARRQHEGLAIARALGLQTEVAARLSGLGRLALLARDWDEARDLHQQALRLSAEHGYTYGQIHAEMGLALGARRRGDLDSAEAHLHHIRDVYTELSSQAGAHLLLAELGFVAELRGDEHHATAHHLRALEVARSLGEPRALALSAEGLAGAAVLGRTRHGAERAALLLGAADAARRSVGAPLPAAERADVDRIRTAIRGVLDDRTLAARFGGGTRMSIDEAVVVAVASPVGTVGQR